jgi:hypothetical protein
LKQGDWHTIHASGPCVVPYSRKFLISPKPRPYGEEDYGYSSWWTEGRGGSIIRVIPVLLVSYCITRRCAGTCVLYVRRTYYNYTALYSTLYLTVVLVLYYGTV